MAEDNEIKSVGEFFQNEHIQIALATGASVIILAVFFKKVLQVPVPLFESSLPGFVFVALEAFHEKRKKLDHPWSRPWPWILIMFGVVALIIARRLLFG